MPFRPRVTTNEAASKRDPRPDVRAADLQEEPTKRVENKVDSPRPGRLPGEHRSERSEPSTQRAERAKQSMRLVDGQTPAAGCSLSTDSSAGSLTRCLPRTEEKVQTLLSRKDTGVTIAIVINCAQ
jgi:hypothetical protein